MRNLFQKFLKDEAGTTLIEYGVALLVAIIVGGAALTTLATSTSGQMLNADNVLACDTDGACITVAP